MDATSGKQLLLQSNTRWSETTNGDTCTCRQRVRPW